MHLMNLQQINQQARSLFEAKNFQAALDLLESVPLPPELMPNLAKCYYYTRQAKKALETVLPLEKSQELWIDTALYHNALGDHATAYSIYKSLDQSDPKVQFNMGWHMLAEGKFKQAFDYLQHGAQCNAWGHEYMHVANRTLDPKKRWQGQYCDQLVMILEGGLGDEIIFVRWAQYLQTRCNHLKIVCSHSLARLLVNSGYDCVPMESLPHINYTCYVPAMSLPAIVNDICSPQDHVKFPYIRSFHERWITQQLDQIAQGRLKIGVRFSGNPEFEHDQFRSPPRQALLDLARYGQLFSLQLDEDDATIPNCKHLIRDWQDTYSVFRGLDLLVTSCTSTAHLAGAMGINAIVLVPLVPYFVWASDHMSWYLSNIRVIRQTEYNSWDGAVAQLNATMEQLCAR